MLSTTVSVLLAIAPVAPPPKTIVPPMFYSEIVKQAKVIALGTVTKTECRYERGKETIATLVTFSNLTYHKGNVGKSMTLRIEGGKMGIDNLTIPLIPEFQVGKKYLVYVDGAGLEGKKVSPIVGFYQGAFEVAVKNGRETLISMRGDELVGIQKDRFVFAAKAPKIPAVVTPQAVSSNAGFKPAHPNVDAMEAAQALKDKAEAKASLKPLPVLGFGRGNAKGPAPESTPVVHPIAGRKHAAPIMIPAAKDNGIRMTTRSLLTMPVGGK